MNPVRLRPPAADRARDARGLLATDSRVRSDLCALRATQMNDDVEPTPVTTARASEVRTQRAKPRRLTKRRLRKLHEAEKQRKRDWRKAHLTPLERLIHWGVPSTSLHLYAKWWQLERWLRDLVQLELQACFKRDWKSQIARVDHRRSNQVPALRYMPSSDDPNPLGFADLGNLREIIDTHWNLFEYALPPKTRWTGTIDTLTAVRHRIAHCRTPHQDDLARVEQALRDLEDGARECLLAYSSWDWLTPESDPELQTFFRGGRLYGRLEHAYDHYETTLHLRRSTRPWSTETNPGILYHAAFHCSKRPPDPAHVWDYLTGTNELPDLVHLNFYAFNNVEAVFAPANPGAAVQLVDSVLEAVLVSERPRPNDWYEDWARAAQSLDYRVHADDYFARADDLARAGRIFFEGM